MSEIKIVARGEEARKKLREKGVTPGKIQRKISRRDSSGKRTTTFYDEKGEVSRVETEQTKGGKTNKTVSTRDLNEQPQGDKPITPEGFQQLAREELIKRSGGTTEPIPASGGRGSRTVYYNYDKQQNNRNLVREGIPYTNEAGETFNAPLHVSQVIETERKKQQLKKQEEKDIRASILTSDKEELSKLQSERRKREINRVTSSKSGYGDPYAGRKHIPTVALGLLSKGLEIVGTEAELQVQVGKERYDYLKVKRPEIRQYTETAPVTGVFTIPELLDIASGYTEQITRQGTDKTEAAITAATIGLGAGVKIIQSTKVLAPVTNFLSKIPRIQQVAKGLGIGLGVGTAGVITADIVTSPDPHRRLGQHAATFTFIAGGFEAGSQAAGKLGGAFQQARITSFAKQVKGKALTTKQAGKIKTFDKDISVEVAGRPVKGVSGALREIGQEGTVTTDAALYLEKGQLRYYRPSDIKGADYYALESTSQRTFIAQPYRSIGGRSLVKPNVVTSTTKNILFGKAEQLEQTLNKPVFFSEVTTGQETSNFLYNVRTRGTVRPATIEEMNFYNKGGRYSKKRIVSEDTRLEYKPLIDIKPNDRLYITGVFEDEIVFESGRRVRSLYHFDRSDITRNLYGTTENPVIVVEDIIATPKPATKSFIVTDKAEGVKVATTTDNIVTSGSGNQKVLFKTKVEVSPTDGQQTKTETVTKTETKTESKEAGKGGSKEKAKSKSSSQSEPIFKEETIVVDNAKEDSIFRGKEKRSSKSVSRSKGLFGSSSVNRAGSSSISGSLSDVGRKIDSKSFTDSSSAIDVGSKVDTSASSDSISRSGYRNITNTLTDSFLDKPKTKPPVTDTFIRPPFFNGDKQNRKGFQAFSRVRGKFIPIGSKTTKRKAFLSGKTFASQRSAATFKVTGGGLAGVDFNTPAGFRKKRTKKEGVLFIEKNKFRIDTPTEVGEISLKGVSAQRKKGGIKWF